VLDLGRFFSFLILYTLGRTPWTGNQPVARPLPTDRTHTDIQALSGIRTHDSSVRMSEAVHALDSAATVIGVDLVYRNMQSDKSLPALRRTPLRASSGHSLANKQIFFTKQLPRLEHVGSNNQ
jgi:hypothetical protein